MALDTTSNDKFIGVNIERGNELVENLLPRVMGSMVKIMNGLQEKWLRMVQGLRMF